MHFSKTFKTKNTFFFYICSFDLARIVDLLVFDKDLYL